ncbi:UTP--glucose-1-phosphate uridylyltransferase [Jatrophihabitans sp. YIM 134969]
MTPPDAAASRARVHRAVIPAAGRGTRMLPFTKAVPKELLPVVSTPTGHLVVEEAARVGCTDVVLVLSEGKRAVMDYFTSDSDLEAALEAKGDSSGLAAVRSAASLATIHEARQEDPLGLGHAVAQAEPFCEGEPFAVLLPDDLVDARDPLLGPMIDVQAEHGGIVLALADVPREETKRYGVVAIDGDAPAAGEEATVRVTGLVEKPDPADAPSTLTVIGRYVLPPEIFDALRRTEPGRGGEIQLTDAMAILLAEGVPVHGVVFTGRRYDTGTKLDYLTSAVQLAVQDPEVGADFAAWLEGFVADGTGSAAS